jgi:hypothetical protein
LLVILADKARDSVVIRDFKASFSRSGVSVRSEVVLYSMKPGLVTQYAKAASAIRVVLENIFYIAPPEQWSLPRLEAQALQKVGFVFPEGDLSRIEFRNLQTEWEKR